MPPAFWNNRGGGTSFRLIPKINGWREWKRVLCSFPEFVFDVFLPQQYAIKNKIEGQTSSYRLT
ncbi:MAG: hypothetical protein AXA67_10295 [Methylothermaceae bacteria B42]|nr:MAG: hypothetical protein AXA67_10295 [Methylothermaceae bacteria B42]